MDAMRSALCVMLSSILMMSLSVDDSITLSPHLHFNGQGQLFYG